MRRRRKWIRRIGRALGTLAIGAMLGFLIPTIISDFSPKPDVQARTSESPIARQFINAFIADDQATLGDLGIGAAVKLRASRFRAEFARVDPPVHLGSYVAAGGFTVHAYAFHVVRGDGAEDLLSWRVVTSGGSAGLIDLPNPIEAE